MNTQNIKEYTDFSELKNIVYKLGKIVRKNIFGNLKVKEKYGEELVTWLDKKIEQEAKKLISNKFGKVNFLGEEFGKEDNGSEITFIIDPLDGTESFINREFNTTISIGVEIKGNIKYGIVYDFMKNIMYEGGNKSHIFFQRNNISFLRENYSTKTRVLISGKQEGVKQMQKKLEQYKKLRITRAYGSIALQIAQTGAGNYDGYIRVGKTKTWDIAGATSFINGLNDTQILSITGEEFNHKNPNLGVIVVRNNFKDKFLKLIN